jgi:hypothetical protein
MNDRRRALIALLDQYPLERDLYLHEGRRDVSPRDEFAEKIECLFDPSLFQQVMEASETYVTRFGGTPEWDGVIGKYAEESDEFYEAACNYMAYKNDTDAKEYAQKMVNEWVDTMVTAGGVLAFIGVSHDAILQGMHETLDKLGKRTTDDYAWYESIKQVAKKSKMGDAS